MRVRSAVSICSVTLTTAVFGAACSSSGTSPSTGAPSSSGTSVATPEVASSSAAPEVGAVPVGLAEVGDCFDYTYAYGVKDVWRYEGAPVDCATPHTAVTIATWPATGLLELPPAGVLPKAEEDAFAAQTALDRDRCTQEADAYLGSSRPSSLGTNLLFARDADGVIQARCDLIATSVAGTKLLPLPTAAEGILAGNGWRAYAQCITAKGKKVACAEGRYLLVADGQLNPDLSRGPFPGLAESTRLTRDACKGKGLPGAPNSQEAWEAGGYYACLRPWTP